MDYRSILSRAGIKGVKSYFLLYGTKKNIFAKAQGTRVDSAWYCEIRSNGVVVINTKYYDYPQEVIEYNKSIKIK